MDGPPPPAPARHARRRACSHSPSLNLSGPWQSDGYTCPPFNPHLETVKISQKGSAVSATKIVGDKCVGDGRPTFSGTMNGRAGTVAFWTAVVGAKPAENLPDQKLTIDDARTFTVMFHGTPMTFHRRRQPGSTAGPV